MSAYSRSILQGPQGELYQLIEKPDPLLGRGVPSLYKLARLDAELKTAESEYIPLEQAGRYSTFLGVALMADQIVAFACHYDEDAQQATISRGILDPQSLESLAPFAPVYVVEGVDWNSHLPARYPISYRQSPNGHYLAVTLFRGQPYKDKLLLVFNAAGELVREDDNPPVSRGDWVISDVGQVYLIRSRSDGPGQRVIALDVHTQEETETPVPSVPAYQAMYDHAQRLYFVALDKADDVLELVIFCPETMEAPITARIPDAEWDLFATEKERRSRWPLASSQILLDVHPHPNGSISVSTEYASNFSTRITETQTLSSGGALSTSTESTREIRKNLVIINVAPDGAVNWLRCLPKHQETSVADRVSALVFHTDQSIHFLYNDGRNNLTLVPGDEPKPMDTMGAGEDIIALATLTEAGDLRREVFYSLAEDKMFLSVASSQVMPDGTILLRMTRKLKEKWGILRPGGE